MAPRFCEKPRKLAILLSARMMPMAAIRTKTLEVRRDQIRILVGMTEVVPAKGFGDWRCFASPLLQKKISRFLLSTSSVLIDTISVKMLEVRRDQFQMIVG